MTAPQPEKIECYLPPFRLAAGLILYELSPVLGSLDADGVAVVGVRLAAEAGGWMDLDEITPVNVHSAIDVLVERWETVQAWEAQLDKP